MLPKYHEVNAAPSSQSAPPHNFCSSQGKLLFCHAPPHVNAEDFQPQHSKFQRRDSGNCDLSTVSSKQKIKRIENVVDKNFFHQVKCAHEPLACLLCIKKINKTCLLIIAEIKSLNFGLFFAGKCAGTHQRSSVRHGLQTRQWACNFKQLTSRDISRQTLEKTRQQEQETEITSDY